MRTKEVIKCRSCGKTDCRVDELFRKEEVSMEEFARRHPRTFPGNWYTSERTARRFVITCQDCGEQYEFMERIEPLPPTYLAKEEIKKYEH